MPRPTARLVIIGNEILSGRVADTNGPFMLARLAACGVRCLGMATVPDDVEAIASSVRCASETADLVFTCGGVGPTHDDVTMEGVALAFGLPLEVDERVLRLMQERWPGPPTAARLRMARLPRGADLLPCSSFPQVRIRNVHVLPGVPGLLRIAVGELFPRFACPPPSRASVRTLQGEAGLVPLLDEVVAAFPDVEVGSYPAWKDPEYRVEVTFEGPDEARVLQARDALAGRLDPARLVGSCPPLRAATVQAGGTAAEGAED